MNNDFSVVRLILDASLPVQGVLALLLIASISSWARMSWPDMRGDRYEP